jgi:hypothetical protein
MTVSELIAALQSYPPDTRAVVVGYESGYDHITEVREISNRATTRPQKA